MLRAPIKTLAVLLLLVCAAAASAASGHDLRSRPGSGGPPTRVNVGLYVIDIESIDDLQQSFRADFVVRLRWEDPRLAPSDGPLSLQDVWHPRVGIFNLRAHDTLLDESVVILPDHTVQYTQRYQGQLGSPFDFRSFPFDEQILPVTLISFRYRPDEVEFVSDMAGIEERLSIPGWIIAPRDAEAGAGRAHLIAAAGEEIYRPRIEFRLGASRNISFYHWRVLAPLSVIIFLSWAVFWIDPTQIGPQIGVSATSILTLIAFLLSLERHIPPVPYLTHLDKFVLACLVMVFLAYVEALATVRMARSARDAELAMKIDRWARALFPVAYGIVVTVFWVIK